MMIAILGAVSMCLIGLNITVEDKEVQGWFLSVMIYVKLIFNLLLIVAVTYNSIKLCLRRIYAKRKAKGN